MEKQVEIRGIPLVKFKDKNVIDSIQKGHIWLNPVSMYRKAENETGDTVVGDKFEAMWPIGEGIVHIPDESLSQQVVNGYLKTTHMDDYVFCILKMGGMDNEFYFTDEQKDKLREFDEEALLIYDTTEFVQRIENAAKSQGYELNHSIVNYYDPSTDNMNLLYDLVRGMENIVFWKRDEYRYQQEIRFVIQRGNLQDDHLVLEVGDISDISMRLSIKDMLRVRMKRV